MKLFFAISILSISFAMSAQSQSSTEWMSRNVSEQAAAVESACAGGGGDACAAAATQLQQTMARYQQFTRRTPRYNYVRTPVGRRFFRTIYRSRRVFAGYRTATITRAVPPTEVAAVTRALTVAAAAAASDPNPARADNLANTLAQSIQSMPPATQPEATVAVFSTFGQSPGRGIELAGQVAGTLGVNVPQTVTASASLEPDVASPF